MAIRNKDGTVYKLRGPNPLEEGQEFWEPGVDDFVLHNCEWNPETSADEIQVKPHVSAFSNPSAIVEEPTIREDVQVVEPTEEPVVHEEPSDEPEKPAIPLPPEPAPSQVPESVLKNAMLFWCMPASIKEVIDDLYGDKYSEVRYGKKFTFEAILVEQTDMMIQFWTTVRQVTKGSVVYPSRYIHISKEYDDVRWWKVSSITEKSKGLLIQAIPTEINPDFGN